VTRNEHERRQNVRQPYRRGIWIIEMRRCRGNVGVAVEWNYHSRWTRRAKALTGNVSMEDHVAYKWRTCRGQCWLGGSALLLASGQSCWDWMATSSRRGGEDRSPDGVWDSILAPQSWTAGPFQCGVRKQLLESLSVRHLVKSRAVVVSVLAGTMTEENLSYVMQAPKWAEHPCSP
jgi:hypothetical protein